MESGSRKLMRNTSAISEARFMFNVLIILFARNIIARIVNVSLYFWQWETRTFKSIIKALKINFQFVSHFFGLCCRFSKNREMRERGVKNGNEYYCFKIWMGFPFDFSLSFNSICVAWRCVYLPLRSLFMFPRKCQLILQGYCANGFPAHNTCTSQ